MPAVVDTGFDEGVYPNARVVRILRGEKLAAFRQLLHPLTGRVSAELFKVRASLVTPDLSSHASLGEVNVCVPLPRARAAER